MRFKAIANGYGNKYKFPIRQAKIGDSISAPIDRKESLFASLRSFDKHSGKRHDWEWWIENNRVIVRRTA